MKLILLQIKTMSYPLRGQKTIFLRYDIFVIFTTLIANRTWSKNAEDCFFRLVILQKVIFRWSYWIRNCSALTKNDVDFYISRSSSRVCGSWYALGDQLLYSGIIHQIFSFFFFCELLECTHFHIGPAFNTEESAFPTSFTLPQT